MLTATGVRDSRGQFQHFLAGVSDITELKETEAALRTSQAFLYESQRAGRIGSYILDLATGHWTSSPGFDEIFARIPGRAGGLNCPLLQ